VVTDAEATDFPEARQLVKVRNQTTYKKSGKTEDATRHFITSRGPAQAKPPQLHRIIRSHWSCESRHWQRDACWGEDRCRLRNPNAACALALIRTTLQSLVRWVGRKGLPSVFDDVAADPALGLAWLSQRHFRS
jgi:predicted transposase YbfD/YdcC